VAPFCAKPELWEKLEHVCVDTGKKGKLGNWIQHVDGKVVPLGKQTMADVMRKYSEHLEFKARSGRLALQQAHDRAPASQAGDRKALFKFIGKEVDRGTSEDAYMLQGEKLMRYSRTETAPFPKVLRRMSDREIVRLTKLDAESISRMRKGENIRP
jgi:hypothetical protein